ncbi:unnamed protein product [Phyllotreta striolata]|uniref:Uncharacterized protein n=1 Tax=Phyllotreta striolata TaxID=444603 RepID=A0A9N9XJ34_PHYSR|nr:unnamed protein product [Phyllotreta striolata]
MDLDNLSEIDEDASVATGQQNTATGASGGLGELSQSDLSSLVPHMQEPSIADNDDIFRHLSDTTAIEIESILSEFSQTPFIKQEENNNAPSGGNEDSDPNSPADHKVTQALHEMRKYTIAAANPILAEKLSTPSEQNLTQLGANMADELVSSGLLGRSFDRSAFKVSRENRQRSENGESASARGKSSRSGIRE